MTLRAFSLSLILHAVMLALLVFSFDFQKEELVIRPQDVMKAVSVDSRQVEQEINRLREIEQKKEAADRQRERELQAKLKELERKARAAEEQRTTEEKRLAELAEKKEKQRKESEAEEKRVAELKKQKEDLEKKKKAEEDERKKQADEQKAKEAAQAKQDLTLIDLHSARIRAAIAQQFNTVGLPHGLSCVLFIRMVPGGEVVAARIEQSSGNDVFDRRAEAAVFRASPLPVPDDQRVFEKMREIRLRFAPD
ncbi:MAG: cell envelope integrity protein TolA [Gammaproteobacteria bacterium]|nr:cell envelope integrity protein TolA [Gammaproteobacteria bacterium]